MIVVSNRVKVPESRIDTFVQRLSTDHGIEGQPGFVNLRLLRPVDAAGFITMTTWESLEDYEEWRRGEAYDRAHDGRSAKDTFAVPNEVEIHEVVIERTAE